MAVTTKTLAELRELAQNLSDMRNSDFISAPEWRVYINLGIAELFDKFVEVGGPDFFLKNSTITLNSPQAVYDLPDDLQNLLGCSYSRTAPTSAPVSALATTAVYETESPDDTVPMQPYNFQERDQRTVTGQISSVIQPNGVPRYRMHTEQVTDGSTVEFRNRLRVAPVVDGFITVWYAPNPPNLQDDEDDCPFFSGYEAYPALYAARAALSKEESDISTVEAMRAQLEQRIRKMASNRDRGGPGKVSELYDGRLYPTHG